MTDTIETLDVETSTSFAELGLAPELMHAVTDAGYTVPTPIQARAIPLILTGLLTLATCVVIGQRLNFANIIALPLLLGIGVAFNIYFVVAWRAGAKNLLQSSLTRAVIFSAATTATGFGTLWLSIHPGTASMGELLMISLFWTLVTTLFLSPALLGPPPRKKDQVDVPLVH